MYDMNIALSLNNFAKKYLTDFYKTFTELILNNSFCANYIH